MRRKMAQHNLLQDVFEQVNLAVAFHQLLHRGAKLLELPRRHLPQAGQGQVRQRQLGVRRNDLHFRPYPQRLLAGGGGGCRSQLAQLLAAHPFVGAQQQRIDQRARAERLPRGGLQTCRD